MSRDERERSRRERRGMTGEGKVILALMIVVIFGAMVVVYKEYRRDQEFHERTRELLEKTR